MHMGKSAGRVTASWRWLVALVALSWIAAPVAAVAATPAHYDMKMTFDVATGRVTATVTVTLPGGGGEADFVLSDRFTLKRVDAGKSVKVDIMAADKPMPHLNRIVVHFPARMAGARQVRFDYSGPLNQPGDDEPAVSPQRIELNVESMWLPMREDLGMRFTVDADISGLPENLVVIPQGTFKRTGDRLHIHRDTLDEDVLIDGAVGLTLVKGPDVDFYAADQADPLVAMLRKHAFGAAAFYHRLYGPPTPGPVKMVIVPRAGGAGYARRSFVVMPTFRKMGDPPPAFDESSPARFVSHEFRHAWKQNIAGVDYDSYWLSESVAEYFALRYVQQAIGAAEMDAMLARKRKAAEGAGPLIGAGRKPSGAALYQKGPLLLFELERRIGRSAVDRVLLGAHPPLSTAAFLKALDKVAGPEAARDFEGKLK
jgi:hypothetical protein